MTTIQEIPKQTVQLLLIVRHGHNDIPQHNFVRNIETSFLPRVGDRMEYLKPSKMKLPVTDIYWSFDGTPTVILRDIIVQPEKDNYNDGFPVYHRIEEVISFLEDSGWELERVLDSVYNNV